MPSAAQSSAVFSARSYRWIGVSLAAVALWILLPPFRVVRLEDDGRAPRPAGEAEAFDPAAFVDRFWEDNLPAALDHATDLDELVGAVSSDPQTARERFGHGLPGYYFAEGEGTVEEIQGRRALLRVGQSTVSLLIAPPVFGNTVRDGTGLLNVNDFSGLEAYNAVSAVLNQKVETEVMPSLRQLVLPGATVSFAGCAKAPESIGAGPLLEFIPLRVEVAP